MGIRCSNLGVKEYRILMLGLDGAGKTAILYKLRLSEFLATAPTIGFNVENVQIGGLSLSLWDVGGQDRIRTLWRHYTAKTDGLIFVVDSTDPERLVEAKEALEGLLDLEDMRGVPVLVIANKQDMQDSLTAQQVVEELDLTSLKGRQWYIQSASARTGEGLMDAMEQFTSMVKELKERAS